MPQIKIKTSTKSEVGTNELATLQKRWSSASEFSVSDDQCLAWTYGTLEKINGSLQVHWHFKIADGKYVGSNFQQIDHLESDNDLRVLAQRLRVLGFEPQGMNLLELPKALNELQSSPVVVQISLSINMLFMVNSDQFSGETMPPVMPTPKNLPKSTPYVEVLPLNKSDGGVSKGQNVWFVKLGKVHEGKVQSSDGTMVQVKVGGDIVSVAITRCEVVS